MRRSRLRNGRRSRPTAGSGPRGMPPRTATGREALEGMIAALPEQRDDARQALVTSFAALGDDDPLVPEFRRRLAAALF